MLSAHPCRRAIAKLQKQGWKDITRSLKGSGFVIQATNPRTGAVERFGALHHVNSAILRVRNFSSSQPPPGERSPESSG